MENPVTTLCFVTTCKGRLDHLKQTLPLMAAVEDARCVVVDYGCPQGSGRWVQEHFPQVQVEFVTDDDEFCLARARNIGAKAVTSPWDDVRERNAELRSSMEEFASGPVAAIDLPSE